MQNCAGKTQKAGKVCVLGSFNIDVSATVPWFPQSGESILASQFGFYPAVKEPTGFSGNNAGAAAHFILKWAKISSAHLL
ncbi:hypothetical protein JS565_19370 [Salmonella enterica subsp. enterica serovar Senftenberg]|nr:hypothetical protein [Salmonella enterica subsp. enterica serovar Senftenberg]